MKKLHVIINVCILAGCRIDGHFVKPDGNTSDSNAMDSMKGPWGTPELVSNINTPEYSETSPSTTADHLELYFLRTNQGPGDIFVAVRSSPTEPWGIPIPVWTTPDMEVVPKVSPDGLELYFIKDFIKIWRSTRPYRTAPWGAPTELFVGGRVALTGDALTMYYSSNNSDPNAQIRKRTRVNTGAAWGPEEPVNGLDESIRYNNVSVDAHGRYIVLSGPVVSGHPKVAEMSRATTSEPYRGLQELQTLTTPRPEHERCDLHVSADVMYCDHAIDFVSQKDIFVVTR